MVVDFHRFFNQTVVDVRRPEVSRWTLAPSRAEAVSVALGLSGYVADKQQQPGALREYRRLGVTEAWDEQNRRERRPSEK
jgi:hypothetical protein